MKSSSISFELVTVTDPSFKYSFKTSPAVLQANMTLKKAAREFFLFHQRFITRGYQSTNKSG